MISSELCDHWVETARSLLAASPEPNLVAAFVFSSAALGDADETSDVDITVLFARDDDFREVTRVRVSELVDKSPPGPLFADIDRISFDRFQTVGKGAWHHQVVNSVVLADEGRYQAIPRQIRAGFAVVESQSVAEERRWHAERPARQPKPAMLRA